MGSGTSKFADIAAADRGGDEVAEGIGAIIATQALFINVRFENIAGPVGVVLQIGESFDEAFAAGMDEEFWLNPGGGTAETITDGRPAGNALRVGGREP